MTYWLRAREHCIVVGDVLAPGGAIRLQDTPQHRAIVDAIAAGEDTPVELVECAVDPSTPASPGDAELSEISYRQELGLRDGDRMEERPLGPGRVRPDPSGLKGEALEQHLAQAGLRHDLKPPRWLEEQQAAEDVKREYQAKIDRLLVERLTEDDPDRVAEIRARQPDASDREIVEAFSRVEERA